MTKTAVGSVFFTAAILLGRRYANAHPNPSLHPLACPVQVQLRSHTQAPVYSAHGKDTISNSRHWNHLRHFREWVSQLEVGKSVGSEQTP
ncbi:MAG: hypothetical protein F6K56_44610 [Moorea sp. SIO3G5]|nr:hypothetical protein [Moorena sp. SIO3G5]